MNEIILKISDFECIKIIPKYDVDIKKMNLNDEVFLYFFNEKNNVCIGQGLMGQICDTLLEVLPKAIDNKLQLHESLTRNLGVMCNEYLQDKTGFFTVPLDDGSGQTWVATEYEICFVKDQDIDAYAITWLYNDHNQNIILEVFGLYKWFFLSNHADQNFISLEEFLQNYTSLVKKHISHHLAVCWLNQIKTWYELCNKNSQAALLEYEFQEKNPGQKELVFKISSDEIIKITSNDDLDFQYMPLCSDVTVTLQSKNKATLELGQDIAGEICRSLILHIEKALDNKLQLHESLTENLGYMYNEYFNDQPESMMITTEDGCDTHWVIYDYTLWSVDNREKYKVQTWMYNDINGEIILELSKIYPWLYIQDHDIEGPDFIYYQDFIKDYAPLRRLIISHDIAITWLQDAKKWLSIFSDNEKKCRKQVFTLKSDQ